MKGHQEPWRHQTQELHQVPVEPVVAVTVQNFSRVNHLLALAQRASDRVCQNRCTPSNSVNLRPAPVSRQSLKIASIVSICSSGHGNIRLKRAIPNNLIIWQGNLCVQCTLYNVHCTCFVNEISGRCPSSYKMNNENAIPDPGRCPFQFAFKCNSDEV